MDRTTLREKIGEIIARTDIVVEHPDLSEEDGVDKILSLISETEPVADVLCNEGLSADAYEERVIEFEAHRNGAMDAYFNARPQLFRTREKECLFEAGFRMAWYKEESR